MCVKYPDIVELHCLRRAIPAICTENGAVFRTQLIMQHEQFDMHMAPCTRDRQQVTAAEGRIHESEPQLEKSSESLMLSWKKGS